MAFWVLFVGCSHQPTQQQRTPQQIAEIKYGESSTLNSPDPGIFFTSANDQGVVKHLKELSLDGDLSGYTEPRLAKFENLQTITLYATENTDDFLDAIPNNVTTMVLEQSDVTATGISRIARFQNLRTLHLSPWNNDYTSSVIDCIRKLGMIKTLSVEWIDDYVILELQDAFPKLTIEKLPHGN